MVIKFIKPLYEHISCRILWLFDHNKAAEIIGFDEWIRTQPREIQQKFGQSNPAGIDASVIIEAVANVMDIDKVIEIVSAGFTKYGQR